MGGRWQIDLEERDAGTFHGKPRLAVFHDDRVEDAFNILSAASSLVCWRDKYAGAPSSRHRVITLFSIESIR